MTLRVEDLKPGDVVRMDLVFRHDDDEWLSFNGRYADIELHVADLAAGNAELVVRPRPVRKGDEVKHPALGRAEFIGHLGGVAYAANHKGIPVWDSTAGGQWTHADGSPIDWEASE